MWFSTRDGSGLNTAGGRPHLLHRIRSRCSVAPAGARFSSPELSYARAARTRIPSWQFRKEPYACSCFGREGRPDRASALAAWGSNQGEDGMRNRFVALAALAGLVFAAPAFAGHHLWTTNEIFTNASGSIQYIELFCPAAGEPGLGPFGMTASGHSMSFVTNLPSS